MPQRTKAQKIAAEQKREAVQYSLPSVLTAAPVPASDYSYVISDLKRIGVFTTLAFGAEIVLKVILQTR